MKGDASRAHAGHGVCWGRGETGLHIVIIDGEGVLCDGAKKRIARGRCVQGECDVHIAFNDQILLECDRNVLAGDSAGKR